MGDYSLSFTTACTDPPPGLDGGWARVPRLDNPRRLGQPRRVETPPILQPPTDTPKAGSRGRGKLIVLGAIVIIGLAVGMFLKFKNSGSEISVQTEKVSRRNITETVIANGKIYPVLQVHISPEVSGEITELAVKEGQFVHKGDLLLKINPDVYLAGLNQAKAGYESSLAAKTTAVANLEKAQADYTRNKQLFDTKLLSESDFIGYKAARDVCRAQVESADDQVNVAKAAVDNAQDLLDKTTIVAPLDGTVTTLNSQPGERVLGTVQNAGTDFMIISDLSRMEARVDIGEMDIVLVQAGQKASLEVDSFKDRKFAGVVTAVADSSEGLNAAAAVAGYGAGSSSAGQSATQFQVRIRFSELESFRPGMSVNATIETRTRTNAITAPIASVTTRLVKTKPKSDTNLPAATDSETNSAKTDKKAEDKNRPVDVVFVVEGDHVKTVPVKIGISDDNYWEITDGLKEGDKIVVGGYHAISHDLDDGRKIVKGAASSVTESSKP